jgi:anhydro-N-acetylmuramic acid kinase
MASDHPLYLGLMSGTSLDAVDAVLVEFTGKGPQLQHALSHPLPEALRTALLALCQPGDNEIERLGQADSWLGEVFAEAANRLLQEAQITPAAVRAIGNHGQTVRHHPDREHGFSLQIGDPNRIAELTGITTVADFRRRDLAAGGQGAPLVPAFHNAVFRSTQQLRVILNIGGMANISVLPRDADEPVTGFDTGPGNVLMDAWIQHQRQQAFDRDGRWAAKGRVDERLLESLLGIDYFRQPPPKSTGRERFNLEWLEAQLGDSNHSLAAEDVQATLCELTAASIADAIGNFVTPEGVVEIVVCGGGARNVQLMRRLAARLPEANMLASDKLGLDAEWVEACAFAWLAQETLAGRPGNVPAVTGARRPVVLGGIYPAGA